ncbi:MAG: hypothetical protein PHR68_04505 [Candidatus Gracilibacteria bacterium]|nr:hypothetical protein [Candidatus Gracilibacteria bacterium]
MVFISYSVWYKSKIISFSDLEGDFKIFDYKLGGYMDMVDVSLPVKGEDIFFIGYKPNEKKNDFFIYGELKPKDGYICFSTFLGEKPCEFIIFSNRTDVIAGELGFWSDRRANEVFNPQFWQKWGEKKYKSVRVEGNKLTPYGSTL